MRHERQVELLQRVAAAGEHLRGLHADHSAVRPAAAYTDEARFERERQLLFRDGPVFFALSATLPTPATTRRRSSVACRWSSSARPTAACGRSSTSAATAAPVVAAETVGHGARSFTCPYHGWVYGTDGALKARPLSAGAFDDVTDRCDLHQVAVAERYGLIFVRPGGPEPSTSTPSWPVRSTTWPTSTSAATCTSRAARTRGR